MENYQSSLNGANPPTILLVDDEINVLRSLKRILRDEGCLILTADSGPEALEVLRRQSVDLIVSDHRMVPMTGIEFLEQAKLEHPDAVRILLTGYGDVSTAEAAINRVEIYRFLNKPWNDADLKATIRSGLDKRRLEKEIHGLNAKVLRQNAILEKWNDELEQTVVTRTVELRDTQGRLIQSEKMAALGTLAAGVAHEINNPLSGILAIAQVLLNERTGDLTLTGDLRMIEQAVLHCAAIVKNLLAFSRAGQTQTRQPAELGVLVDQVMLLIGHLFRAKNLELARELPADLPPLRVSPREFQQVLLNLLVNAQQAMTSPGQVTLRASADDAGVVIEVEDEGPGIPAAIRSKVFDPFFTTKPEGQGTGLGLSVAYRIVTEHGGRLEIKSPPGRGACLRMIFAPDIIAPPDLAGDREIGLLSASVAGPGDQGLSASAQWSPAREKEKTMDRKPLIFIVDDDASLRYSLARYFAKHDVEVKTLANGFEVLLMCLYMLPDLIVSDIRMPKLDGIALLQGLQNNAATRKVPVIFMSAYPSDRILEDAKRLGARYFLMKPFPLEYLDDLLARALPAVFASTLPVPKKQVQPSA